MRDSPSLTLHFFIMQNWFNSLGYYQKGDVLIAAFVATFVAAAAIPTAFQKLFK